MNELDTHTRVRVRHLHPTCTEVQQCRQRGGILDICFTRKYTKKCFINITAKDHNNIQKKPEENERKLGKAGVKEMYEKWEPEFANNHPTGQLLALPKLPHLGIYFLELLMHERGSSTSEKSKARTLGFLTLSTTSFAFFEHPMRIQDKPFVSSYE